MGNSKNSRTRLSVLTILVVQNCSLILIMRYSRIQGDAASMYIISTAVLVLSQLKIVTTAIFSVAMLSRKLSVPQYVSILSLTLGVALVQYSQYSTKIALDDGYMFGIICILLSCVTSGFSGVYFEKVLKTGALPLWLRNIHLSLIGLVIGGTVCIANDSVLLTQKGFFHGYTPIVWVVILLQAGGGLVVANVVMYADNVLKGFATSFSVVLSCVISAWLLEASSVMNPLFVLGAAIVVGSALVYSLNPAPSVASSIPSKMSGSHPSDRDLQSSV